MNEIKNTYTPYNSSWLKCLGAAVATGILSKSIKVPSLMCLTSIPSLLYHASNLYNMYNTAEEQSGIIYEDEQRTITSKAVVNKNFLIYNVAGLCRSSITIATEILTALDVIQTIPYEYNWNDNLSLEWNYNNFVHYHSDRAFFISQSSTLHKILDTSTHISILSMFASKIGHLFSADEQEYTFEVTDHQTGEIQAISYDDAFALCNDFSYVI